MQRGIFLTRVIPVVVVVAITKGDKNP